jgi:putative aldouronate transport system permease protein
MNQEKKIDITNYLLYGLRIIVVLLAISMFVPALNPAKISGLINKNLSLFTSGFVYATLSSGFKRALVKEWVERKDLYVLFISSMLTSLGLIVCSVGGALSLGEIKFKKLSTFISFLGSLVSIIGVGGIYYVYTAFTNSTNLKKVEPSLPLGIYVVLILVILSAVISLITYLALPKPSKEEKFVMLPKYYLFLLFMPFIVLAFVFSYLPLWGWRYAFFDYKPGLGLSMENFVGFKWFNYLIGNPATRNDILRVLKNTLAMSGLSLATSFIPLAFAIFLSEIKATRYRKLVQTFTTIPNFISWVLVYAFAFALFSTEGFINRFLIDLGVIKEGVNFLLGSNQIWIKMLLWGLWKGLGWGAIIYLAAISGIDQQLYEAATVDGAGRFKKMWYITVPGLLPTYFVLLMLAIAGILSNGMEQYFVFKNSANKETIEVLDLYVYLLGLGSGGSGNIPLATVVGMVKSIISVSLLFFANGLSKAVRKESII